MTHTPPPDLRTAAAYVLAAGIDCPDCLVAKDLRRDDAGVWRMTVTHARTCPWLAARGGRWEGRPCDRPGGVTWPGRQNADVGPAPGGPS